MRKGTCLIQGERERERRMLCSHGKREGRILFMQQLLSPFCLGPSPSLNLSASLQTSRLVTNIVQRHFKKIDKLIIINHFFNWYFFNWFFHYSRRASSRGGFHMKIGMATSIEAEPWALWDGLQLVKMKNATTLMDARALIHQLSEIENTRHQFNNLFMIAGT